MWTVYDHPRDFPAAWVARRWEIGEGRARATGDVLVSDCKADVRHMIQDTMPGAVCLHRQLGDDPGIVETWL
jgi:hypothetical protein